MSMTVPRFEPQILKKDSIFRANGSKSVVIKDHLTDLQIVHINFCENSQRNIDLANKIIETIEEFIEDDGNGE